MEIAMAFILSIFLGIFSSIIASVIIFYSFFKMRPKLEISPYIAWEIHNGKRIYWFKIVNLGKYPVYNLKFKLHLISYEITDSGRDRVYDLLHLDPSEEFSILEADKMDDTGEFAEYEVKISCESPLADLFDTSHPTLLFEITGTHAMSQWNGYFKKSFDSSSLKKGAHGFGYDLEVREHKRV